MEDNRKKLAKLSREEYRSVVAERLKAMAELHDLDTKVFAEKCGISTRRMKNLMNGTGRVLIRPSGTQPLVRVMLEGKDEGQIRELAQGLADLIKEKLA